MPKPLSEMSERELQSARDKSNAESSKVTSEMIEAGRGTEKPSETRTKNDALSERWKKVMDRHNEIVDEERKRQTYHGSLKPIKRHRW